MSAKIRRYWPKNGLIFGAGYCATPSGVRNEGISGGMQANPVFCIQTSKTELVVLPPEVAELEIPVQVRKGLPKYFWHIKLYNLAGRIPRTRES